MLHSIRVHARADDATAGAAVVASDAFAALYATHVDAVYRYCLARLGDPSAAEDVASQVFARALAAGPRYDDPAVRAWLLAIAHNLLANHWRDERPSQPLDAVLDLPDGAPGPEEIALAGEASDELRRALAALPDDQRRVVELRLAGLTGAEIAAVLGRSHAAVKMLQLRAYRRLRTLWQPEEWEAADARLPR